MTGLEFKESGWKRSSMMRIGDVVIVEGTRARDGGAHGSARSVYRALRAAQVREGKIEDDHIPSYKLAQAASSSGVSQSLASADSAASVGTAVSA